MKSKPSSSKLAAVSPLQPPLSYYDWCDDYYSRQTRGDGNESTIVTPDKLVGQFGKKAE